MFTKLSVLIPTRHRVGRLCTLLDSYNATRGDRDSELVFRVDEDDESSIVFLRQRGYLPFIGPRMAGYASVPAFFNEAYGASTGDVLMGGNDDMVFRTPGWDTALLEAANRFPDGLFDLGVSTHNETHYPFFTVSRAAADVLGFVFDPTVFWGDIFWRDVMAVFGRRVMVPEVRIDHDWAGSTPDDVYREGLPHKARIEQDPAYWTGPHAGAVSAAVEKLRPSYVA